MAISVADRKRLRDGAGGECSFPDCRIRDHLVEALIVADKPDGPRGDASFAKVQLDSYDNRILLCPNHHAVVDGDSGEWEVEKLRAMKTTHEQDVARRLGQTPESTIILGEPTEYPNEYADRTHLVPDPQYASSGTMRPPPIRTQKERVTYRLYRIPVTSEGRDATRVYVHLAKSTPPLQRGLATPILHLAGENPADHVSFSESRGFSLTNDVPREVDMIAITKTPPYRCFIFNIASDDAMEEHELDGKYIFQLAVVGGGMRDYKVEVDLRRGTLSVVATVATKSKVEDDFWLEPGAPKFRVNPGVHEATAGEVKLLMTFTQIAGDDVTPVVEWSGANIEPSQPLMMPENQPPASRYQKYQLKPSLARPTAPNDEVTFDIRFRWQGATRQYRWTWPLYIRDKGIWGMRNVAENTLEPLDLTTLV